MGFDLDSMGRFGFDMDSMRPDLDSISIGLDWIDPIWIRLGPKSGFSLDSIYQSGLDWARSGFDCARLDCARTELDFPIIPMLVRFAFLKHGRSRVCGVSNARGAAKASNIDVFLFANIS